MLFKIATPSSDPSVSPDKSRMW